jgi:hypothetical protein
MRQRSGISGKPVPRGTVYPVAWWPLADISVRGVDLRRSRNPATAASLEFEESKHRVCREWRFLSYGGLRLRSKRVKRFACVVDAFDHGAYGGCERRGRRARET